RDACTEPSYRNGQCPQATRTPVPFGRAQFHDKRLIQGKNPLGTPGFQSDAVLNSDGAVGLRSFAQLVNSSRAYCTMTATESTNQCNAEVLKLGPRVM